MDELYNRVEALMATEIESIQKAIDEFVEQTGCPKRNLLLDIRTCGDELVDVMIYDGKGEVSEFKRVQIYGFPKRLDGLVPWQEVID